MSGLAENINVERIPTLPAVAVEAIRLLEGDPSNFESVADLLRNDQVLSGRILRYANAAFVGARQKITSIPRAISLLGFNTVRGLILSVSVFDCFSDAAQERLEGLVNFWLHAIGVAAASELLAEKLGFANVDEAYLAGLVHDIGKLICYQQMPNEFSEVCLELEKQGGYSTDAPLALDVERRKMGLDHTDAGRIAAEQWMFPASLVKALASHHQPVPEAVRPEKENLYQLVRFADVICVCHNIGSSYFLSTGAYDHQHYHFALENFMLLNGIEGGEIDDLVAEVVKRIEKMAVVMGFHDSETYQRLLSSANVSLGAMSVDLGQQNHELLAANRVLDAACGLGRSLKPGLTIAEALREILLAAQEAFGVKRCLCLALDDGEAHFRGQIYSGGEFAEFSVPHRGNPVVKPEADMETEALQQLRRASMEFEQGTIMESGVAEIIAGSEFMAGFFLGDQKSHGRVERIIGELLVDFKDASPPVADLAGMRRNFELLSTAAANGIDRILMEKDLNRQTMAMAAEARKLEEHQRQLFNTHRLATVGRLAAGAAHEINNPLTIISLNLQIMQRLLVKQPDDELRHRLEVIADQERRISKIIGDLMGFARPNEPKFTSAQVRECMDLVLGVLGDRVSISKIEIVNNIPADLPPVFVDAMQIEQVFMNLLINAIHAMPKGGRLELRGGVDGHERVVIAVMDNGVGISRENLGKIFDPFFTTKRQGEGTGLGLAVCHSIIEHNGGVLQVESVEGEGSTFSVRLPIDHGVQLRDLKKAVDQKTARSDEQHEVCRILIIDDERLLNEMLQECLRAAGYDVDGAYDGVEGIGMLRYQKYHLIMLDVRMPRKDGLEVLKFMNREFPDIPVIIVTGLASLQEIKNTVKMGAFACLKKPFVLDKVLKTVNKALTLKCKHGQVID
ncbi:HDOD domain-containing protein [Desulfobacterota bacterium M19]